MRGMSDDELGALPATVDLPTAGRAFGLGRTMSYELARAGKFPCPVLPLGSRFRVTRTDLFSALGMPPDSPDRADATEYGDTVAAELPPAGPGLPEGGIPVVLVLQAVLLPGSLDQFAGGVPAVVQRKRGVADQGKP